MGISTVKSIIGVGSLGLTLVCLATSAAFACAEHEKAAKMAINHPVLAVATMADQPSAIFLTVTNGQKTPDTLMAVETPMCGRAELHDHIRDGDIMRMRQVKSIPVAAGASIVLKPGGLHIMCFDPVLPQNIGQKFPLTLTFDKSGKVDTVGEIVTFAQALTAGKPDAHDMNGMDPHMMNHMDHVSPKDQGNAKAPTPAAK